MSEQDSRDTLDWFMSEEELTTKGSGHDRKGL